jgi:hypothetical protein
VVALNEYYSLGREGLREQLSAQGFQKAVAAAPLASLGVPQRSNSFGHARQRRGRLL